MRFSLNSSSVYYEPQKLPQRAPMSHAPMDRPSGRPKMINASRVDPEDCAEYRKYRQMGDEICQALEQARSGGKQPAGAAPEENIIMREAAQDIPAAGPWTCPACGGANTGKFCEYCGSPRPLQLPARHECCCGRNDTTTWEEPARDQQYIKYKSFRRKRLWRT